MKTLFNHFLALGLVSVITATAFGTISVQFVFDPSVPMDAQNAANAAGAKIGSILDVASGMPDQTITVDLKHASLGAGILGGATPQFCPGDPGTGFNLRMVPNSKAVLNNDCNGAAADVVVEMSSNIMWDYIDPITATEFDYQSTILHEVFHGMGFAEGIAQNGGDLFGTTPGDVGMYTVWDQYVGDSTGALINASAQMNVSGWNTAVVGGAGAVPANGNGLYWHGPAAKAANGGNPVPLYSPTSGYEPGSSGGGHMDTEFYGFTNRLMNHAAPAGMDQRVLSPEELGMFLDIGYTKFVPEPSSSSLLLLAMLGGLAAYRPRR